MKAQVLRISPVYMLFSCDKVLVCVPHGDVVFGDALNRLFVVLGDALNRLFVRGLS